MWDSQQDRMSLQSGQVLLIVVLIMVVTLTVGLSVVSRGVTSLRTSTEEQSSQLAFSAAEAGIESALQTQTGISTGQTLSNNATIDNVTIEPILGSEFLLNGGSPIPQDDGVNVWLSTYPYFLDPWSGTLTIFWGSSPGGDTCSTINNTMAALEIIVITGSKSVPVTTRSVFDPCTTGRRGVNNFSVPTGNGSTVAGKVFPYSTGVTITNGLIADIIPLYANTPIGISGSNLPAQGNTIISTGSSGTTQRRIQVFQPYPKLPSELFQYSFFHSQ